MDLLMIMLKHRD